MRERLVWATILFGVVGCGGTVESTTGVSGSGAGGSPENAGGTGPTGGAASSGAPGAGGAVFFGAGGAVFSGAGGALAAGGASGVRVPVNHRPYPDASCAFDTGPAPPPPLPDAGAPEPPYYCRSGADCTEQANGRCVMQEGYGLCVYDQCYSSPDCSADQVCDCGSTAFVANRCVLAGCRADADCGVNGFCSPTFGYCGSYAGIVGYQCHTSADTCVDDADCQSEFPGRGYCAYDTIAKYWKCSDAMCVG